MESGLKERTWGGIVKEIPGRVGSFKPILCMTNFERSHLFNNYRLLDIFPDQITFTQKVQSGNIKFIQNLSPFGIADFAESAAL